jgi:hypothetical protein
MSGSLPQYAFLVRLNQDAAFSAVMRESYRINNCNCFQKQDTPQRSRLWELEVRAPLSCAYLKSPDQRECVTL